jgi:hypothetical protein
VVQMLVQPNPHPPAARQEARVRQALHGTGHRTPADPARITKNNGMLERSSGRIEDVLQSHHFQSGEELEATLPYGPERMGNQSRQHFESRTEVKRRVLGPACRIDR